MDVFYSSVVYLVPGRLQVVQNGIPPPAVPPPYYCDTYPFFLIIVLVCLFFPNETRLALARFCEHGVDFMEMNLYMNVTIVAIIVPKREKVSPPPLPGRDGPW